MSSKNLSKFYSNFSFCYFYLKIIIRDENFYILSSHDNFGGQEILISVYCFQDLVFFFFYFSGKYKYSSILPPRLILSYLFFFLDYEERFDFRFSENLVRPSISSDVFSPVYIRDTDPRPCPGIVEPMLLVLLFVQFASPARICRPFVRLLRYPASLQQTMGHPSPNLRLCYCNTPSTLQPPHGFWQTFSLCSNCARLFYRLRS